MNTVKAWAAGIVDGEGHITIERYKSPRGIVRVDNTDIRILIKLQDCFEGKIYTNFRKNRPKSKPCWFWILTGLKVVKFLQEITPYLISKQEKANEVIEFYSNN